MGKEKVAPTLHKKLHYGVLCIAIVLLGLMAYALTRGDTVTYSSTDVVSFNDYGISFDQDNPLVRNGEIVTRAATPGADESETGYEVALSNALTLSFATTEYKDKKTAVNEFLAEYTNCEFEFEDNDTLEIESGEDYCMLAVLQENLLDGSPTANLYVQKRVSTDQVDVVVLVTEQKLDTGDTVESVLAAFGEEYVSDLRLLTESIN